MLTNTLRFSLRTDAGDSTLDEIRERVELALGCRLKPGGERYDMFLFEGELLGMEILLGEWQGLEGRRTFQLHGSVPVAPDDQVVDGTTIDIGAPIIDLLRLKGAGEWRIPTEAEIYAEAEYGAEREREAEAEAAELWKRDG
jgi:hypothetical protein